MGGWIFILLRLHCLLNISRAKILTVFYKLLQRLMQPHDHFHLLITLGQSENTNKVLEIFCTFWYCWVCILTHPMIMEDIMGNVITKDFYTFSVTENAPPFTSNTRY